MAVGRLSFNNPRRGKQPRAAWYVRWPRILRRKRVAWSRASAAEDLRIAQRSIAQLYRDAKRYGVPLDGMPPLPALPELPGDVWVNHLQAMDGLAPVVKSAAREPVTA